ncbi:glycosyl hydrolase 53 family protein [Flectobacillus sp. BAB-3569]|uniref:glycosyl hydrolase 53 family protein n=1 Tax=Flectobacillus sp. BAB-3569 TaxID=1509483 RepID=UPI000BA348AC|nr:glycosyl hydrolase 53 family protein [Flectobacillus sp. BAB-3569]PAC26725.1 arabinogalactan endo-1,4-beta-galactosidase [Flectobacillus sp. BAB-3569]
MKIVNWVLLLAIFLLVIDDYSSKNYIKPIKKDFQIRAMDISFLPLIRSHGVKFKNSEGRIEDPLFSLKRAGVNTIRIRIWNNPTNSLLGVKAMQRFSDEIKRHGLKVYLTLHYSDTWADPSNQQKPQLWQNLTESALNDSVYHFTKNIVDLFEPDYIQTGNEINNGFLWPEGHNVNSKEFKSLITTCVKAVRDSGKKTKIIMHYSGLAGANLFFQKLADLDYDMVGISYYPKWHGNDFEYVYNQMNKLSYDTHKKIIMAETAYPFTLDEKDQAKNIIASPNDLASQFPATPEGQQDYINHIKRLTNKLTHGAGFCYWGGAWVSTPKHESVWDNQALWDHNLHLLPAALAFKD